MEGVDPFALWSSTSSLEPRIGCPVKTRKVQRAASMPEFQSQKESMTKATLHSGLHASNVESQQRQPHGASAHFLRSQRQKDKSGELAMPKRQRRVWETLASVESYSRYSDLSHITLDEAPTRALAEQRAMCEALSRPRASAQADDLIAEPVVICRTAAEQHSYCSRLARKPRTQHRPASSVPRPEVNIASQRRSIERLTEARHSATPCPLDSADVARDLARLRGRKQVSSSSLTPVDSPRHPRVQTRRSKSVNRNSEEEPNNPDLMELRKVIEELLWVSLLTLRSCPGGEGKNTSKDMIGRLNGIILDVIVPVLQPMARFVLPSGSAIVKRLQNEWPESVTRLRLHMAGNCRWDSQELRKRSTLVRECRDILLAKDFTKTLAHRLVKPDPEKPECSLTREDCSEVSTEASLDVSESSSAW